MKQAFKLNLYGKIEDVCSNYAENSQSQISYGKDYTVKHREKTVK